MSVSRIIGTSVLLGLSIRFLRKSSTLLPLPAGHLASLVTHDIQSPTVPPPPPNKLPLTIPRSFLVDVLEYARQDPRLLSVGGNTGTPNSFAGIDITALTKGVFNGGTLAQGNNLQCFIFQLIQAEAPGVLTGLYSDLTKALQPLTDSISGALGGLGCPQLMGLDESLYEKYPGYKKNPAGL